MLTMAIIKRPQKNLLGKFEKGEEAEASSLPCISVVVNVSKERGKITRLLIRSSSWYTMKTSKLNKHVIHMLKRVPDELESSVTDGKEKKIQLVVTSCNFTLHPKTGNTWKKIRVASCTPKLQLVPSGVQDPARSIWVYVGCSSRRFILQVSKG